MTKIQNVNKGDIIVERIGGKNRMTPIRKVEINVCSKPSVHINGNQCWDWNTDVRLAEAEGTVQDLAAAVEEIENDEDLTEANKEFELDRLDTLANDLVKA